MMCTLYFTSCDFARFYQPETLDYLDTQRLKDHPDLEDTTSWRNSRSLKAWVRKQHPQTPFSLSHKDDFTLIFLCDRPFFGVDLEKKNTQKDVLKIISNRHIGSSKEREQIQQSNDKFKDFFKLWTIKEALIKAEGLPFPTAMKSLGFKDRQAQIIRSPAQCAYHYLTFFTDMWIGSCLWQAYETDIAPLSIDIYSDFPVRFDEIDSNIALNCRYHLLKCV